VGFEALAVQRVRGLRPRHRWGIAAAVIAVAIGSSVATGAIMHASTARDHQLAERYLALLEGRDNGELITTALHTVDGGPAGQAYAYQGEDTHWIFVVVNSHTGAGVHDVVLIPNGATGVTVGHMKLVDGRGSWGATTVLDLRELRIQLVSNDGHADFEALFRLK